MMEVRKSGILRIISLLIIIYLISFPAQAQYGGGTGEPNDPYLIYTAEQMNEIGLHEEDWDGHFKLMADIDLRGYAGGARSPVFNIIGYYVSYGSPDNKPFIGVFDGNGHTTSNFSYISTDADCVGLFGYVDGENALIKDLGLIDPYIVARTRGEIDLPAGGMIGSLVGSLQGGTITNCYMQGGSVSGDWSVGSMVGWNNGTITDCYSSASVSGDQSVGGLVGDNWGTISNCYSSGDVSGDKMVGGLVGHNDGNIATSYSTGTVTGNEYLGGLVGENGWFGEVVDSFWDIQTSGRFNMCGGQDPEAASCNNANGKTTAEMQSAITFLIWSTCGNEGSWKIDEGNDYPRLWWQNRPGEPIAVGATLSDVLTGAGTEDSPYLIYTGDELNAVTLFPCDWDKHFRLMADIDLRGYRGDQFNIIGTNWDSPFTGVFDGDGHTVSNLTIIAKNYVGLFGLLGSGAKVTDLGVVDVNITGSGDNVGGLVGENGGSITNCYSTGSVMGADDVGGLAGENSGDVTQCWSSAMVTGNKDNAGGLVGYNSGGLMGYATITTSYSMGTVSGGGIVGGLVGQNGGSITNCYITGTVSGKTFVGGLVGYNMGGITTNYSSSTVTGNRYVGGLVGENSGSITTSYSTGTVSGGGDVGGLVGSELAGEVTNCFWDTETSGHITSAGGRGMTTAEMQDIKTYLSAGWDFVDEIFNGICDYWQISPGDYPMLHYHIGDSPVMPEGLGTTEEPYLIRDARNLGTVWFEPLAHYRLEASINLSGITWTIAIIPCFGGTFDGNGYVISNLHIRGGGHLGLFGQLDSGAKISNLGMETVDVNGTGGYVAGLAGTNGGTIATSYSAGKVSGTWDVGGLVGQNGGSITTSYSAGTVSGGNYVGGLVGDNSLGSIATSYSSGAVSGTSGVGGLVGFNAYWGSIATSYSTGMVSGNSKVGGLVGENVFVGYFGDESKGIITTSYSIGTVTGNENVGGLVGSGWASDVTNSFWDMETSDRITSSGGTSKTTSEMQTEGTFLETGWDFMDETKNGTGDIWWINEGQDYPRLWWELSPEN